MRLPVIVPFLFSLLILLSSLTLICPVQAYTTVTGTITQDTTWTKTGSPYILATNVHISNGVTLTIEPGVIVNLAGNWIYVDGVLNARGTDADKIIFQRNVSSEFKYSSSQIVFTSNSKGWNEQNQQGCIIENTVINSVTLSLASSVKLSKIDSTNGVLVLGGSPLITNSNFNIYDSVNVISGSLTFSNNVLIGHGESIGIYGSGNVTLSSNSIAFFTTDIKVYSGNWLILNNDITHCNNGIELDAAAKVTIQNNTIHDTNINGITGGSPLIENNSIIHNIIGIHNPVAGTIIRGNNIVGNTVNSVTATTADVSASSNYWGTTDLAAVNKTIYDYYDDASLGKVFFMPILTAPNPDAPWAPNYNDPVGIEVPTGTASPSPTIEPAPDYTPMPTVNHGLSKSNDHQDTSLLSLNTLVVAVAVPLGAVWVVVLLGYRVKGKIRELRQS